jgi:GH24 family phage-related lysozyme (muramidase)
MKTVIRISVAVLSLSAAAFVGRVAHEGYTDQAIVPTQGDVPTLGFGMTKRPDGSPVQMGDRTTPVDALQRSLVHLQRDETELKQCVKVPLSQAEYDMLVDHAYQYGVERTCASGIVRLTNQLKYAEACQAYLSWRFMGTFDCSTPGNKRCMGVWKDAQRRERVCTEAQ